MRFDTKMHIDNMYFNAKMILCYKEILKNKHKNI